MAGRCCDEPDCRRTKPLILAKGSRSGYWYVLTNWNQLRDGSIRSVAKHKLPHREQVLLEELLEARNLVDEALEVLETLDVHGRSRVGRLRMKLRRFKQLSTHYEWWETNEKPSSKRD